MGKRYTQAYEREGTMPKHKKGTTSMDVSGCEGCKHRMKEDGQWCYMFIDAPVQLPCGQHDQFKEMREQNGKEWLKKFKRMQS